MAFTDLGNYGSNGATTNNQTTLTFSTVGAASIGDLIVLVIGTDNIANGGDDLSVTSVSDPGGSTWTKAVGLANALAAQAGASVNIWYSVLTAAIASNATITINFGSATLVDASAVTARRFSTAAGTQAQLFNAPTTLVNNAGGDPGSLDNTTASITALRVRGIASQVGNNTNLTPTASWTAWSNGNSATTGTTGEICARAESRIFTGTGAASDPTYVSAVYASAYCVFEEALPPVTGTLGASEAPDIAAATGDVAWTAALAATEAADSASLAGDIGPGIPIEIYPAFSPRAINEQITFNFGATAYAATAPTDYLNWEEEFVLGDITGTLGATEAPDTALVNGAVQWNAALAASEAPDTAAINGAVQWNATLAASEAPDTALINGTARWDVTLAASEASDTVIINGAVRWNVTLLAVEAPDTALVNGTTSWNATLAASEAPDTALVNGTTQWNVTLAALEAPDAVVIAGSVFTIGEVSGSLAALEAPDTALINGAVTGIAGILTASEAPDTALVNGAVRWNAALAATEAPDTALVNGAVRWNITLAATEAPDTALINGATRWNVTLAATETPDAVSITGSVFTLGEIAGSLVGLEAPDTVLINGAVTGVAGTLAASEAPDTALVQGVVLDPVIAILNALEAPDAILITGTIPVVGIDGILAASETADTATFYGDVTLPEIIYPPEVLKFGRKIFLARW